MSVLTTIYRVLIHLYPRPFREEFGAEMTAVFAESVLQAKQRGYRAVVVLIFRELLDFPSSLWQARQQLNNDRKNSHENLDPKSDQAKILNLITSPSSTSGINILAGVLPFILFGLMFTIKAVSYHTVPPMSWPRGSMSLYIIVYITLLIGLGIGWMMNFPRWTYAYLGVVLINAYWLLGDDQWGFLAWLPLLVLIIFMLVIGRTLRPLLQFFQSIWREWALLSFALYGAITWLLLGAFYDNKTWYNNTIYLPLNMFLLTLVITSGAFFYMQCRRPWRRVLSLQLAIIPIFLVSGIVESLDGNALLGPPQSMLVWLIIIMMWSTSILVPGILGLVRKASHSINFV